MIRIYESSLPIREACAQAYATALLHEGDLLTGTARHGYGVRTPVFARVLAVDPQMKVACAEPLPWTVHWQSILQNAYLPLVRLEGEWQSVMVRNYQYRVARLHAGGDRDSLLARVVERARQGDTRETSVDFLAGSIVLRQEYRGSLITGEFRASETAAARLLHGAARVERVDWSAI